jgi:hypothetical protein
MSFMIAATVCLPHVGAYVVLLIALVFSSLCFACNVHGGCPLTINDRNCPLEVHLPRVCWALQPMDACGVSQA